MTKILIPVDFSAASRQAMRYGYYLAEHSDAKVILLHVFDIPLMVTDAYVFAPSREEIEEIRGNHITHLDQFVKCDSQVNFEKVNTTYDCIYGNPQDQIIQYAKEINADLIIMGIQGRCVRPSYFMGSTFVQIMNHSPVPVIALHGSTTFSDLKHILFTYDLKVFSNSSILQTLLNIAECFKAHIYVLNVCKEISEFPLLSEKLLENELGKELVHSEISFHVVQNENIIEGIKEFLKNHPVDLISFIPREHTTFSKILKESITRKAAFEIDLPIMSIHN